MNLSLRQAWLVAAKDLRETLRDSRTLWRLLLPNLLVGPLMLLGLTGYVASLSRDAQTHIVHAHGIDRAPTLAAFFRERSFTVLSAPDDYPDLLHARELRTPVVEVPADFEARLAAGEQVTLAIVSDSTNDRASASLAALIELARAFGEERARSTLSLGGVTPSMLHPVLVAERDIATPRARTAKLLSVIPFFLMAALFMGAQAAALDSAAGERERGSLDPLLMNPVQPGAVLLGKWGAVLTMGAITCMVSSASLVAARWFIPASASLALATLDWGDALYFWVLQIPLAAAVSALLLTVALRCRSVKEAQAATGLAWTIFTLLLLVPMFDTGLSADWHRWVPGLAQSEQMQAVLSGDPVSVGGLAISAATCAAVAVLSLLQGARAILPVSKR